MFYFVLCLVTAQCCLRYSLNFLLFDILLQDSDIKQTGISYSFWTLNYQSSCVTDDHAHVPFVVITMWSFPQSLFITGFVIRVKRRVPHVEQKLLNLPEHLIAPAVFSIDHVARFLVYCAMFCRSLAVCLCSFVHCLVFSSLIYSLWLLLSYLQIFFYRRGEIKIWPFVINRIFILYYID